jgi:hypothetical protein
MNNETREQVCREALVAVPGDFRPLTAGSCCILGLLQSPLAALSEESLEYASELDVMAFAWAHAAPLEDVRAQAVAARSMPQVLLQHVLAWAETKQPDFFARAYAHLVAEFQRVAAGMAVHSKPTRSKNGYGQSGLSQWSLWPVKTVLALGKMCSGIFRWVSWFRWFMPRPATTAAR